MTRRKGVQPEDVQKECALLRVRSAARAVTRHFEAHLRTSGLKGPQFSLLVALGMGNGLTASELEGHLGTDRSTLVRNLKPLEAEGLVTTAPEGRAKRKLLTAKGRTRLTAALPLWRAAQDSFVESVGEAAWSDTRKRLRRIRESL